MCKAYRLSKILRGLFFLCLQTTLVFAAPETQRQGTITAGCEIDYPPFCLINTEGEAAGFSVELLRSALQAVNYDVSFTVGSWNNVKKALEEKTVQVLPLVGRTPEREMIFNFTVPYLTVHGTIVTRKDAANIKTLNDLTNKQVAVMKGDNAEEFVRRSGVQAEIILTGTFTEALQELARGNCDAVVVQEFVARRLISESGLTNLRFSPPLPDFKQSFCFAVHKDNKRLLAVLNEGLSIVIADGTFLQLQKKWFPAQAWIAGERIIVGGDWDYPPYEFMNDNGEPAGYNVDLTHALAKEIGVDVHMAYELTKPTLR